MRSETKVEKNNLLNGRNESKGKHVKSRPDGPVHCTMEGSGGTQGSGNSYMGRPGSKELEDVKKQCEKFRGKAKRQDPQKTELNRQRTNLENAVSTRDAGLVDLHSHPSTKNPSATKPETHRGGTSCGEAAAARPILANNEVINTSSATRTGPNGHKCTELDVAKKEGKKGGGTAPGCDTLNLGAVPTDYLDNMKLNVGTKKCVLMAGYYVDHESEDPSDQ